MQTYFGFSLLDVAAFVWFFLVWTGHFYLINRSRFYVKTISHAMAIQRERWMLNVVARNDSPVDAILQNGLQQGVLFFASTTVLLLGGLAAGLGAADRGVALLQEIPMVTTSTRFQWEFKLLLIMFIFVFAFFKFAWSYRLYNYILILFGGAPKESNTDAEGLKPEALASYAKKMSCCFCLDDKRVVFYRCNDMGSSCIISSCVSF